MNTRTGATGTKEHLYTMKVFWSTTRNKVVAKVDGVNTACNKMVQNNNRFSAFMELYKDHPEICCKKCVEKMNQYLQRAKSIDERNK